MKKSLNLEKKHISIDIDSLKEKLKHGDYTKIAAKLNISPQAVGNQFRSDPPTVTIETAEAALKVLKEEQDKIIELNKLINKK